MRGKLFVKVMFLLLPFHMLNMCTMGCVALKTMVENYFDADGISKFFSNNKSPPSYWNANEEGRHEKTRPKDQRIDLFNGLLHILIFYIFRICLPF